jgi:hypothetical protein
MQAVNHVIIVFTQNPLEMAVVGEKEDTIEVLFR